jgi:hypothetical protein
MKDGSKGRSVPSELRPSNRRLEAFSEGIFAIVVTIMILEIRIPDELAIGGDPLALMRFTAVIATYALSFVVIAIFLEQPSLSNLYVAQSGSRDDLAQQQRVVLDHPDPGRCALFRGTPYFAPSRRRLCVCNHDVHDDVQSVAQAWCHDQP